MEKKTIKFIRKKVKRFKKKNFKKHKNKRNFKFFKKWKKKKFFPKKFFHFLCSRKRYRRTLIVYQFRKRFSFYTKAVERFFRFSSKKNSYKSKPQTSNFFYFLNSTRSLKHSRLVKRPSLSISRPSSQTSPLSQTFFNKSRSFRFKRRNPLYFFNARRRFPKIYLRNFSIVRKSPLSFFFMRFSKKHNSIFRVFKPKRLRYKKRIKKKDPRRFRWLRRVKFYQNKIKKFKFNFINRKLFSVKKSYGKFFPYQGFFKSFGKFKFKYRSRRIKFFRYFKKYFSRFSRFSGLPRPKFFYKKKKISKIKIFIHIFRSVNNMFISVSAPKGRNLYSYSAGRTQFRGSKRLSPIAIETMGKTISSLLHNSKIKKVAVVFHTPVDFLVRALLRGLKSTLNFSSFRYHLNKPHNGLRLRASRRILFIIFRMWCNGNISALGAGAVGSSPAIQIAV
jgi:ribosomal protein S11